jgi:hypothetical protein
VIDLASLLEFLMYAGSAVVIGAVFRGIAATRDDLSPGDFLVFRAEPRWPAGVQEEDEPVRWRPERLSRRRRVAAERPQQPVAGAARRSFTVERPIGRCETS